MAHTAGLRNHRKPINTPPMDLRERRYDDRTAIAALFVVFALLVQLIAPTSAMASPDGHLIICSQAGMTDFAAGGSGPAHKRAGGMSCHDCLAAAPAIVATPDLALQPVAYEAARVEHVTTLSLIAPRARAPPRPPGQGPPTA